jgi:CDP-diacylglycerol--glycerol-3-phosphate 3-phosphatidyltransferase/cardiolipin synthase
MPINIPILLTWLRIILIPLLIALYDIPETWLQPVGRDLTATVVFVVAALTDWWDGYLARRWNETSAFGAFLDPVADKLVVAAALIMLVEEGRVGALIAVIIIGREITISALREWMAGIGARKSVAVSMIGKIKTTAQMIAIPLLLYHAPLCGIDVHRLGTWLIYVAAVLTLWSMGYYMRMALPHLVEQDRGKR